MNPATASLAVILQLTQSINLAQTVMGELPIPQGRIHVQVTSPDHHGSLSCLITANNQRIIAGQILQGRNTCDFYFNNPVATNLMLYVQNGDDFPHDYTIVVKDESHVAAKK
jgi:hypothetical protein